MKIQKKLLGVASVLTLAVIVAPFASAASTAGSQLSQTIGAGALSTDFRDGSNNVIASPSFTMSGTTASTGSVTTSTGTFGDSTHRISVDNPDAGGTGGAVWTLALSGTGAWTAGASTYPFNSTTSAAGQLTVDPSVGAITANVGGATGVTKGTSATFNGTVTSITLMSASSSAATMWNGYLTGVSLSQTIPAGQAPGAYSLTLTQTVTAS